MQQLQRVLGATVFVVGCAVGLLGVFGLIAGTQTADRLFAGVCWGLVGGGVCIAGVGLAIKRGRQCRPPLPPGEQAPAIVDGTVRPRGPGRPRREVIGTSLRVGALVVMSCLVYWDAKHARPEQAGSDSRKATAAHETPEVERDDAQFRGLSDADLDQRLRETEMCLWIVENRVQNHEGVKTNGFLEWCDKAADGAELERLRRERDALVGLTGRRAVAATRGVPQSDGRGQTKPSLTAGRDVLDRLFRGYPKIDAYYRVPQGGPRGISLCVPMTEWVALSEAERESIYVYLAAHSPHWEISAGRVSESGTDIMLDSYVMRSSQWKPK